MKKSFWLILTLGLLLVGGAFFQLPDAKLHLVFCDVGQGDAILIIQGSRQILIDGGPNDKVLNCLSRHLPFWDRDLELVVLTHPESDHITGLTSVIERYNVIEILSNSLPAETGVFSKFRNQVIDHKIPVFSPKKGDIIKIGPLELKILYPLEKLGNELVWQNKQSLAVLGVSVYTGNFNQTAIASELQYRSFKVLLPADIESSEEKLIENPGKVNVLKVAHHGSKYSSSEEFLEKIQPEVAVISVGANNRYGHPAAETLERLKNLVLDRGGRPKILRTDLDGEIEIVSDGQSWKINQAGL